MPTRVVVADDQQMFLEGLRKLFEPVREFAIVGEATDGAMAIELTRKLLPDLLILDHTLPKVSGLDVLRALAPELRKMPALVVTAAIDSKDLLTALQLGARGLVMKQSGAAALFDGIRFVIAGEYVIGRMRVGSVLQALQQIERDDALTAGHGYGLTTRELEIIEAVLAALSNKEIAERLHLSEKTVKHHLTHIFAKVGVTSRLELAAFAQRHHLKIAIAPPQGRMPFEGV